VAAEQPLGIPGRLAALAARLGLPEFTNQEAQLGVQWDELGRGERAGELLELGELTDHPDTVATTWALSLARAQAPAAQAVLALCAFVAPTTSPAPSRLSTPSCCQNRCSGPPPTGSPTTG
jgi:hypothetical protein